MVVGAVCVASASIVNTAAGGASVAPIIIIVTLPAAVALGVSEAIAKETVPVVRAIIRWFVELCRKIHAFISQPGVASA